MSRLALEDQNYELIKAHILDPGNSPLSVEQQTLLDRLVAASKILEKHPITKQAVAFHRINHPEISLMQAYRDVFNASRLFNTAQTFNYDYWHTWLINDIVSNIQKCRSVGTEANRKIMAMEHANLLKAIGIKPQELPDPKRMEKHQFYIMIQNNNQQVKVDLNNLQDLPPATLQEINKFIYGGSEISESDAEQIMNS